MYGTHAVSPHSALPLACCADEPRGGSLHQHSQLTRPCSSSKDGSGGHAKHEAKCRTYTELVIGEYGWGPDGKGSEPGSTRCDNSLSRTSVIAIADCCGSNLGGFDMGHMYGAPWYRLGRTKPYACGAPLRPSPTRCSPPLYL
jgi:hypothetical protein